MIKYDTKLNEFEIRAIEKNCSDFILKFQEDSVSNGSREVFYTRVSVLDSNGEEVYFISTGSFSIEDSSWSKLDIEYIIDKIINSNNSPVKPVTAVNPCFKFLD